MKEYFKLQFKMLNRSFIDFGLPLLVAYTLLPFAFFVLSSFLFEKTEFAKYIYVLFAFSFILKLNETDRNDFLKAIFSKKRYIVLRVMENIVYSIPFTLFLIFKKQFVFSMLLNLLIITLVLFSFNINRSVVIPTPFGKKPFEFSVGFRKTFYIFIIAYLLTYVSISVNNFNLGVFSLLLIAITCFSFYSNIENDYYVWNFNQSPKVFLLEKVKIGMVYFSLISLPVLVGLGVCFFEYLEISLLFFILCNMYLMVKVFAKYSSFPKQIDVPKQIIIALSFIFPPLLLVILPVFYKQSIKRLNTLLND